MADLIEGAVLVHLEYGDAMIIGHGADGEVEIGVERKTIGDLVNSITTGRLSGHQLPGLLSTYYKVYLIVEGMWIGRGAGDELEVQGHRRMWKELERGKRKFRASDIWAYLTTLEATGVVVRTTYDLVHTCQMIKYLAKWWGKEWGAHRGHDMLHKGGPPAAELRVGKPSMVRRVAAELPGIGWKRARSVESLFRTVEDLVVATEEELREIEGVGEITARAIYKSLHMGE
jgi:ERCC4-type nuclease